MTRPFHRVPSSLDRSMELLSMETELHDLLNNSQLSYKQKATFEEMLTATFDLLQAPLQRDHSQGKASLIDSSSIALYSKMQELVSALAALIMNEEDVTRMEDGFSRMELREVSGDDSTEFSDGDEKELPLPSQEQSVLGGYGRRSMAGHSNDSSSTSTPRLGPKKLYVDGLVDKSRESLRSPSFNSPKLPPFDHNHGQPSYKSYQPVQRRLQVMNTPVPRSFSYHTQKSPSSEQRHSRPTSMYVSPSVNRTYDQSFDQTYNPAVYASRRNSTLSMGGSQVGTPSQKKRYSMRF